MKLQDKKAVTADLATQRKTQIDQGVQLASKIDVLRETLAKEEGNLGRFRAESIKVVQLEIDALMQQKNSLRDEVRRLEQQRQAARIPLDAEWEAVRQQQAKLAHYKQGLDEKSYIIKECEEQVTQEKKEVEIDKNRAADLNHRASESLAQAEETLHEAREASAQIRNKAQATLFAAEAKEKEVSLKEKEVELREEWVEKETERQQVHEVDLANREKALKDRYATLARTIKRIKNG